MSQAVILDGVRTPIGKFNGALKDKRAPELGAICIREALSRSGIFREDVEEVIMGNVLLAGLGQNPARQAALLAGLPNTVNAFQVGKVCGSGLKAVSLGAQAIRAQDAEVLICGGQESMTNAPALVSTLRSGLTLSDEELTDSMVKDGLYDCYNEAHMGSLIEYVIKEHDISRNDQDAFALESHRRAIEAMDKGYFQQELCSVDHVHSDEGPRRETSLEVLTKLKPVFDGCKTVTAGNASTLNDGAAALVLASQTFADKHNPSYAFVIEGYHSAHTDPKFYGTAPVIAVRALCKKLRISVSDFELIELNEAFAAQSLAVIRELNLDPRIVNVCGGAIALGHPIGASGARILVTLIHQMQRLGAQRGLATLCLGGGGAVALSVIHKSLAS